MSRAEKKLLTITAALLLALAFSVSAVADVTISYRGETPVGSGLLNEGITGLSGGNDSLWDYVYDMSGVNLDGPSYWAIYVPNSAVDLQAPSG